jgi:hypothetical protein
MTTVFIDYPTQFSFRTKKQFANDMERTTYLHSVLKRNNVPSPCHGYNEYVVEFIETISEGYEFWFIGS